MSSEKVELARRGYEAIKRGDLTDVVDLLDEHVKWHAGDPMAEGACRNRKQALAFMRRPERRDPGELIDIIDAGDRIVVILQPPPIDGEPAPMRAQLTTFRDGKVIEMAGYPTVEAAFAEAGVEWRRSSADAQDSTD
jgi:ketosteroid isomerase-like protein